VVKTRLCPPEIAVRTLLKILALLVVLLLVVLTWLRFSAPPEPLPEGSASAQRLLPGPYRVASFDEEFIDDSRPTAANRDFPGAPQRRLAGTVWYPDGASEVVPLLVFSHGFGSLRSNGAYLAQHLASHGFAVAAVDYPLTNMRAPGRPMVQDVVNQPADVSFVLDVLLAHSSSPDHRLYGRLDGGRIGVFGISLGGLTSTLLAYHPEWRDPRVAAVLSIAGPTVFFTPQFFAGVDLPFLMLAGDLDALVPYAANAEPVPRKVPGGELLTVEGGSHTGFSGGMVWFSGLRNPDAIGCYAVLRNIDNGDAGRDSWDGLLGSADIGLDYSAQPALCEVDPLPRTLNVLRQQMIARLVVTAFFEREFAADPLRRAAAARFLSETLARELDEVSYDSDSASNTGS
jgi:predicted dienelactone hydrolase